MVDGEADEQEPLHQQEAESAQEKALRPRHSPSLDDTLGKSGWHFKTWIRNIRDSLGLVS